MKNESSQKKQKHVYIRVDKEIEPGDLVRCIEDDNPCKVGDIRNVRSVYRYLDTFMTTQLFIMYREKWEVVHKLKVGDLVEIHKSGRPMKVTAVDPEFNRFRTPGMMLDWYATDQFRMYQKPKTESIKAYDGLMRYAEADSIPVGKAYGINKVESDAEISLEGALAQSIIDMMAPIADGSRRLFAPKPDRKAEMQKAVAEMIVELLDKEDKENCPQSSVFIANWRNLDNTVTALADGNKHHEAKLHPNDTWDTLTGVFVALSKATNRKLPDWVYEKEDPDGIS